MKFNLKRNSIKIPSDISIFYDEKLKVLLIKNFNKKKLINLTVRLLILHDRNTIVVTDQLFENSTIKSSKVSKSFAGLTLSKIKQSLLDISIVNHTKLKLVGVGYKVFEEQQLNTQKLLHLKLGYSHSLYYKIPKEINIKTYQGTKMFVSGQNFAKVSQTAASIRLLKKPEPYKGKGILYLNETIKLKEGKKV